MGDEAFFHKTHQAVTSEMTRLLADPADFLAVKFPADDPLRRELERFFSHGGKRLRPALSLSVARFYGHKDVFPHLALETFHKYLLAHDDIIDRDDLRYGHKTIHAQMAQSCPRPSDQRHFGVSLAIIGGNLLEAATHRIILQADVSEQAKLQLSALMIQAVEEVAWGWYDQFVMDYLPLDAAELSFERIEKSIIWVTGKYSVKLPLLYGHTVAAITPPSGMEELADVLGALFQTGDDLLGLFGDVAATGKSNSGDIVQGKKTLPMWFTFQNASARDQAILKRAIGNPAVTTRDIETVRRIVHRSGGFAESQAIIQRYKHRCLELLESMEMDDRVRRFLRGFVSFAGRRNA